MTLLCSMLHQKAAILDGRYYLQCVACAGHKQSRTLTFSGDDLETTQAFEERTMSGQAAVLPLKWPGGWQASLVDSTRSTSGSLWCRPTSNRNNLTWRLNSA